MCCKSRSNLIPRQWGWSRWSLKVSSDPSHSMIYQYLIIFQWSCCAYLQIRCTVSHKRIYVTYLWRKPSKTITKTLSIQNYHKNPHQNRNPHDMFCLVFAVSRILLVNLQSNMLVLVIDNEVSKQKHTQVTSGCFPVRFGLFLWE